VIMTEAILHIIGIDLQHHSPLPEDVLSGCRAVVVSSRFRELLQPQLSRCAPGEIISMTPLGGAIERIRENLDQGDVAVLASGDPLFFGIGRRLIEEFGRERVKIYPAVSAIQHAFARFRLSWEGAVFVSLHGRNRENGLGMLLAHRVTAVLTDIVNRPEIIAGELLGFLGSNAARYTVHVGENLGMENERCVSGSLREIAGETFGGLCCLLLVRQPPPTEAAWSRFGLHEEMIVHSRGLITKDEVRAAALHALAVPANSILWDVGAGSGSVGLEAARMQRDILVYAIEKSEEQQHNILENTRKYDVLNLKLVKGEAPAMLTGLPRPHRVFIGGSGGNLQEIVHHCVQQLLPGGRMVVTAVLEKTLAEAPELMHRCGLAVEMSRIAVQRTSYPEGTPTTLNPITIIVGKKQA